jgi:hypothetical protein
MSHVRELLRQVIRREEMNSRLAKSAGDNDGQKLVARLEGLDHGE